MKKHVLITGTGRAGTSYLVQYLTNKGVDTGFKKGIQIPEDCRGGLEHHINRIRHWPYVVKYPDFAVKLDVIAKKVIIEHIIVPVRNLQDAAMSRVNIGLGKNGGLWRAKNYFEQIDTYQWALSNIVVFSTLHNIPVVYLNFNELIKDTDYIDKKLKHIFKEL